MGGGCAELRRGVPPCGGEGAPEADRTKEQENPAGVFVIFRSRAKRGGGARGEAETLSCNQPHSINPGQRDSRY